MDVIIFSGQSNMQGQTEGPADAAVVPHAYEYRLTGDRMIPLAHPVGEDIGPNIQEDWLLLGAHQGKGSLVPDFCRAYTQMTGREALAIHAAKGATMVCQWLPGTPRFDMLIHKVQSALACLEQAPEKIYFVWLQGESDAIAACSKEDYKSQMMAFRQALCQKVALDAFAIIRVGRFVGDARDDVIIRAQEELCEKQDFLMLTRVTGLCTQHSSYMNPQAPGHYNNAGMALIGRLAGENLARYCLNIPLVQEPEPYRDLQA